MNNLLILIGVVLIAVMALFHIADKWTETHEDFDYLFEEDEDEF